MSTTRTSFYFFDFDNNIMKVSVPFVLTNTQDGTEREMTGHEYMGVKNQLEKPGPWQHWSDAQALKYYRDLPGVPAEEQPFVRQVRDAIGSGDPASWKAPAWGIFAYACNEGRHIALITARGHADDTVRAGFRVLKDAGLIAREPDFLAICNVSYPPTMAALGDPQGVKEVDERKRVAILQTVHAAVARYGADAPHRFGMSDDTMTNVELIGDAMRECKETYPNMRFFVISTNRRHLLKAEIFPINVPVDGHGDPEGPDPLHTHGDA